MGQGPFLSLIKSIGSTQKLKTVSEVRFTYYIAIEFPDLDHDAACYQYVSGRTEPVHALHVAMYQQVQAGARFFLTYEPVPQ